VRPTIKTIVAAAAMIATATAVQHDANAAFPAFAVQAVTVTSVQQLRSDGYGLPVAMDWYSPQPMAYGYSPLLKPYFDSSQFAQPPFFDGATAFHSSIELPQRVSLGQEEELVSPAPARSVDPAPERLNSPAPRGQPDLPPAGPLMVPIVRIQFNSPMLAPMAHTFFCLKYRDDCKVHKVVFRGGALTLTAKRWAELVRVNAAVNRAIAPHPNTAGLAAEKWLIAPKSGECHDYAVTKRHELLALGWPERDLLLSEVVTSWGEHHLVLVIRTSDGDFVADSLTPNIRSWSKAPYQWVRIQSPGNPTFWSTVASTTVWAKSSGLANPKS
jgi:predicted transglutaminase-like cysteine proteinase